MAMVYWENVKATDFFNFDTGVRVVFFKDKTGKEKMQMFNGGNTPVELTAQKKVAGLLTYLKKNSTLVGSGDDTPNDGGGSTPG